VSSLQTELEQRKHLEAALREVLHKRALTRRGDGGEERPGPRALPLARESVEEYAIFMLDADGRVSSWNAGAERSRGTRRGDHRAALLRFYPPRTWRSALWSSRSPPAKGRFEDEGWRVRKDGTRFWANVVISRMRDLNGRLVGFAKVTRDLTPRRQLERSGSRAPRWRRRSPSRKRMEELRERLIGIVGTTCARRSPRSRWLRAHAQARTLSQEDARATARIARTAERMSKIISELLASPARGWAVGSRSIRSPADRPR